jgi:uncharacterized protein YdaU (DUF1376 family)
MSQRRPPEPVYIPLYPRDFLSSNSVDAMTTEEVGAYLLLMMRSWSEAPPATLPTDDATLARMARMTPARWAKSKAKVLKPWEIRDDRWVQPRLEVEYHKSVGIAELRSKVARVAAKSRWSSNANAMHDACSTHPPSNANAMPENAMQGRAGQSREKTTTTGVVVVDVFSRLGIENLRGHVNATPARVAWIEREADGKRSPQSWAAQCIRDGWAVPSPNPADVAASEKAVKQARRQEALARFEAMTSDQKRVVLDEVYQRFPNLVGKRIGQPGVRGAVATIVSDQISETEQGAAA